jgi:hypothetical protein
VFHTPMENISFILMKNAINRFLLGFVFEKEIAIYKKLGVKRFKKIVPFGDYWILLINKIFSKKIRLLKSKEDAIVWIIFTLGVEFLHLVAFFIMIRFAIKYFLSEEYLRLIKTLGLNLIINVYPIMIQRYNRLRIIKTFNIEIEDLIQFEIK